MGMIVGMLTENEFALLRLQGNIHGDLVLSSPLFDNTEFYF